MKNKLYIILSIFIILTFNGCNSFSGNYSSTELNKALTEKFSNVLIKKNIGMIAYTTHIRIGPVQMAQVDIVDNKSKVIDSIYPNLNSCFVKDTKHFFPMILSVNANNKTVSILVEKDTISEYGLKITYDSSVKCIELAVQHRNKFIEKLN